VIETEEPTLPQIEFDRFVGRGEALRAHDSREPVGRQVQHVWLDADAPVSTLQPSGTAPRRPCTTTRALLLTIRSSIGTRALRASRR